MKIIPAIDLIEGECVRLVKGNYGEKTTYSTNPLEVAEGFAAAGLTHLHLVDLDGARLGHPINGSILKAISAATHLQVDFSGGLRTLADVESAFTHGATKVTLGSMAVKNPTLFTKILQQFGPEKVILGADVKDGQIAISGWETSGKTDWQTFLQTWSDAGIREVMVTDIAKDGMMEGPGMELYQAIRAAFPTLNLIASGGVSSLEDLAALKSLGMYGAIIGKAIYEGQITLKDLAELC